MMGEENFSNCSNITLDRLEQLALVRGVFGVVCFALCLLTLFVQLGLVCKVGVSKTNTLQRLFFYLTVSTVLYMGVLALHIEHYYRGYNGQSDFCRWLGFFDQYTGSVQLVFTFFIAVVLLFKIPKLQQCSHNARPADHNKRRNCGIVLEILLVFVAFFLPAVFSWIPFKYVHYGETGPWCWIESLDQSCNNIHASIGEQLGLWYVPYGFVAVCSLLFTVPLLAYLCWVYCTIKMVEEKIKKLIGEIVILCMFMGVFCMVWLIEVIIHLVLDKPNVDVYALWLVYAIVTPVGGVVIPIGFFVYLNCKWGKCKYRGADQAQSHPDISDARRGVAPTSTRISYPSDTQAHVQSLEHSDVLSYSDLAIQPLLQISDSHGPRNSYRAVET